MCRIGIAFKYVSPILSRTAFADFDYAVVLGNEDVRDDSTAYRTTFMPHAGGHRRSRLAIRASHLVFGLAPEDRIASLWAHLMGRMKEGFGTLTETNAERRYVQAGDGQRHLMMVS